jgi:hypothetical protein
MYFQYYNANKIPEPNATNLSFYPVPMQVPGRHTPPPPNLEKHLEEAPLSRGDFQKELSNEPR